MTKTKTLFVPLDQEKTSSSIGKRGLKILEGAQGHSQAVAYQFALCRLLSSFAKCKFGWVALLTGVEKWKGIHMFGEGLSNSKKK